MDADGSTKPGAADSGKDDLIRGFLDAAEHNSRHYSTRFVKEYDKLSQVEKLFQKAAALVAPSTPIAVAGLLFRSRSAFLGATRLALSGQVAEAYMVLRGALESALYGLHIAKNPDFEDVWLCREESPSAKQQVRKEFSYGNVSSTLRSESKSLSQSAARLYERTIDRGGHPNLVSLLQSLELEGEGTKRTLTGQCFTDDETVARICLKTCAQIGVCCILIWERISPERFELTGLSDELDVEKEGL